MTRRFIGYNGPRTIPIKLPWPEVSVPKYKQGKQNDWRIVKTPASKKPSFGYFRPFIPQPAGWMLQRRPKVGSTGLWNTWMSLTMMEQESHMPHIAAARGHVVVAGLGMGMYLFNILRKPEVVTVTVVERDPDILRILRQATDTESWVGYNKLTIVEADALSFVPPVSPDFLYADIWPFMGDSNALPDTVKMQQNMKAKHVGFWTQEYDFADWLMKENLRFEGATAEHWNGFVSDSGLPLIGAEFPGYHKLAVAAVMINTGITKELPTPHRNLILTRAVAVLDKYRIEQATHFWQGRV